MGFQLSPHTLLASLLLLAGSCAPRVKQPGRVDPTKAVGQTHQPYRGKPAYLASAHPLVPTATTQPEPANACLERSPACDQRLRAALAALDLQVLALSAPPTELQLRALELGVRNVAPLLVPYPDLEPQLEEVADLVTELPTHPVAEQTAVRKRMIELSDLMRVQLATAH
jgi:hypothetical protein